MKDWCDLKLGERMDIETKEDDRYHGYCGYVQRVPEGFIVTNFFTYSPYGSGCSASVCSVFVKETKVASKDK